MGVGTSWSRHEERPIADKFPIPDFRTGAGTSWFRIATYEERPIADKFPMHLAARNGDQESLKCFLDAGISPDNPDGEGYTPLHYAAMYGRYEAAECLVRSGCDLNVGNRDKRTPVLLATRSRHRDVVELLVRSGADVERCSNADAWTVLHYASYKGWLEVVRIIASNKSCDLDVKTSDGDTALLMAARIRNEEIIRLLIKSGANTSFSGNEQWTLLHYASYENWTDIVQMILEKKESNVEAKDMYGNTPLHMACYKQHIDVVRLLVKAGANVNAVNNSNETTFNSVRKFVPNLDAIKLLIEHGACLNATDYMDIDSNPILKQQVLGDVGLCAQAVVNRFNNESLPALYRLPGFDKKLPRMKTLQINERIYRGKKLIFFINFTKENSDSEVHIVEKCFKLSI
ncbi:hypothetical protein JTE90_015276 [Oedothorax gibbosus]|uniref:Alpha-latrotoxin n=1 Tax=Oedothorax gibbosus TaxID=931172 RepID=A0AAV6UAP7_9ARAC|nr:hypothetical protein JTE90_015276 [Oedothorax gibbosus]